LDVITFIEDTMKGITTARQVVAGGAEAAPATMKAVSAAVASSAGVEAGCSAMATSGWCSCH
jgi:hypothetical protein